MTTKASPPQPKKGHLPTLYDAVNAVAEHGMPRPGSSYHSIGFYAEAQRGEVRMTIDEGTPKQSYLIVDISVRIDWDRRLREAKAQEGSGAKALVSLWRDAQDSHDAPARIKVQCVEALIEIGAISPRSAEQLRASAAFPRLTPSEIITRPTAEENMR